MYYLRARREFEERSLPPEIEYPTHIVVEESEDDSESESESSPSLSEESIEIVESPLQEMNRILNAAAVAALFAELEERLLAYLTRG